VFKKHKPYAKFGIKGWDDFKNENGKELYDYKNLLK